MEAKKNGEKFPIDEFDRRLNQYDKMYRDLNEERDAYQIGLAARDGHVRLDREYQILKKAAEEEHGPITPRPGRGATPAPMVPGTPGAKP
jgi:hypothetical protein